MAGRVIFVCEHGAAKSVLAAACFNALAGTHGLPFEAVARGTAPDPDYPPSVREWLTRQGLPRGSPPEALAHRDLVGAVRIVTFDRPEVAGRCPPGSALAAWDGLPAVSADFERAREAIEQKVGALLESLSRERPGESVGSGP